MENSNDFRSSLAHMSQTMLSKIHLVGGVCASRENQNLVTSFYNAWLFLASDVTLQIDIPQQSRLARLKNFCLGLQRSDLVDVLTICQDAVALIISDDITDYGRFKDAIVSEHPGQEDLLVRLLAPISPLLVSLYQCPDVKSESLRWILPFLRYGRKLNLKAIGLEEQAIEAYLQCEERLATVALQDVPDLVSGLNRIMRTWLRELCLKDLVPQHGGGCVAEGSLSLYDKFNALQVDVYLKIVLGPVWPEFYPRTPGNELVRVSRTVFVPKTFSKLRTISMEPATLQYFQQGVMKKLYEYIERHPYLGRRIKLRDQTQNQQLAKQGSIDDSFATIDLSAASDSVSWSLVKAVFARTPLLKWLYATRSKETKLPSGQMLRLQKFAPMGSALCFPVECLIFAAVVEYVSQKWCGTGRLAKPIYSVFGDDIVVDTAISNEVVDALMSLGFLVNRDKSFLHGKFKESCGKDYYDGCDVSSVYYTIDSYNERKLSPEVYSALCSAVNLAAERGLHELRGYLLHLILPKIPYFTDTTTRSPMLYSPTPTNYHARKKWNVNYQCWLGRFCQVLSKPVSLECDSKGRRRKNDDDIAYFVTLAEMAYKSNDSKFFDEQEVGVTLHGSRVLLGHVDRYVDVDK